MCCSFGCTEGCTKPYLVPVEILRNPSIAIDTPITLKNSTEIILNSSITLNNSTEIILNSSITLNNSTEIILNSSITLNNSTEIILNSSINDIDHLYHQEYNDENAETEFLARTISTQKNHVNFNKNHDISLWKERFGDNWDDDSQIIADSSENPILKKHSNVSLSYGLSWII
ncbi:hypothetical protein NPIL_521361 [Nephila pilipes]|uniref:Uncharacterized protein n=1 Tax=Nephila pilipes TaxID=299642 RepID=A0A8X6UD93_NEPPI|nr:hypothetical protein NPIL_521361 [Nephila pilipes]